MASTVVKSNRMKRMESRKSHSWWWDSHISPKNSKWLQENLEEMDQHVKRMLKLIEEDADSFAKKAEMYYQKRPELISLVEEFYRMYRSLAERYDHVTGELRKNIPSDLQSQSSGLSDVGSESPSNLPSPRTNVMARTRKSGSSRPVGFEYFLGHGREGDESSTLDSESESDDSSDNNYSGGPHSKDEEQQGLRKRIIELEAELREVKEKLVQVQEEEISHALFRKPGNTNYEDEYLNGPETVVLDKIGMLKEELRIAREKVQESENEVASLRLEIVNRGSTIDDMQDQLKSAQNELEKETREVLKLQECVMRHKTNLTERDREITGLKEALSNANKSLSEENEKLQAEISRISNEKNYLSDNLKELDLRCQSLEEDARSLKAAKEEVESILESQIEQLKTEKDDLNASIDSKDDQIDQMNNHLEQLHMEHVNLIAGAESARKLADELRTRIKELEREVKKKEATILEGAEEKREAIRQLCFSLEHYRNGYYRLREVVMSHKRTPVIAT